MTGPLPYPVSLPVAGRLAVIVGGGTTAVRQVAGLRPAGAEVLVVAPALTPFLQDLAARGLIAVRRRGYQRGDLAGAWLVYACTGRPAVDEAVAADAEELRLWCIRAAGPAAGPAGPAAGPDGTRRRVLVLGGARSGKSAVAEGFLTGRDQVDYVATGSPPGDGDPEWAARVAGHRQRRPAQWRTVETLDLEAVLRSGAAAPVLVDCLSAWLARVMDDCGAWDGGEPASEAVAARAGALVDAWRGTGRQVVAVSSEVGSGVVPATGAGRLFRDALGDLNARIAAESDEVWLCTAGIPRRLR